jgi:hypothetical protein
MARKTMINLLAAFSYAIRLVLINKL